MELAGGAEEEDGDATVAEVGPGSNGWHQATLRCLNSSVRIANRSLIRSKIFRHHSCHTNPLPLAIQRQDRNGAPAGSARSRATSCSSCSNMPSIVTQEMAQAQMPLDFPLVADKMDKWRATIRSVIEFPDANRSQLAEPSRHPPAVLVAQTNGRAAGGASMVQSLPQ